MKKIILLIVIILFTQAYEAFSCSCRGPDNFCVTTNKISFAAGHGVMFRGIVINHDTIKEENTLPQPFINVKILNHLKGAYNKDTAVVLGQDGLNCLESLRRFNPGDTIILAFGHQGNPLELSFCGIYFLQVFNGQVNGNITSKENESMAYDSFLNFIDEAACKELNIERLNPEIKIISISPNPCNGIFNLTSGKALNRSLLGVYNVSGQMVHSQLISTEASVPFPLSLENQPKGVYFIRISDNVNAYNARLMIE